jgi:hypothetical protein
MEKIFFGLLTFLCLTMVSSCAAIEGIFKAGMFTGILVIVGIIALLIFVINRVSKKG